MRFSKAFTGREGGDRGQRARRAPALIAASAAGALVVTAMAGVAHAADDEIEILDDGLRACLNDELGQAADSAITEAQATGLTGRLDCASRRIENLSGAEHLTGIAGLKLDDNNISDLTPVSGLVSLTYLELRNNNVADLEPVTELVNLEHLGVQNNEHVEDITPLARLTKLTHLNLWRNKIEDISVLAGLTELEDLWLHDNQITDVAPLAELPNLAELRFEKNHVTDISTLASLHLSVFSGAAQEIDLGEVFVGVPVANPLVGLDGDPIPLDGMYDAGDNTFTPLNPGVGSVSWEVTEVFKTGTYSDKFSGTLSFTAVEPGKIDIPDDALRKCINEALGQDSDADITDVQAQEINALFCEETGISDLTGIGQLSNLNFLIAPDNSIVDLGPLAALGAMATGLDLSGNLIEDVTPLASMTFGEFVDLSGNQITDVSALEDVAARTFIDVRDQVVDLGELVVGEPHDNPVVGFDGSPIELSDLYDAGDNTFTPVEVGRGSLTWVTGLHQPAADFVTANISAGPFTGTLLFTVIEAPEPPVEEPSTEPTAEPTPEPTEDPTEEPAPPAVPQAEEPALPATGASVGPTGLLVALGLVVAGAGALVTLRRA